MKRYRAHYKSPHTDNPVSGDFEFESENKAGSKLNMNDARIELLEIFGNEALSWDIVEIEAVRKSDSIGDNVQMGLDFREPKKIRKHHTFQRGKV